MTRMITVHRTSISALALSAAFALASASPAAADWPTYGHDLSNSRSAGPAGPTPTQAASLAQAWKFDAPNGDFTGTPVVAGGTLVAGTNLGSIYALDAATGKLLWSHDVGQAINASAAIDLRAPGGPTVFVPIAQIGSPRLIALSLATGDVRWDRVLSDQDGSDVYGSPVFRRGTVYIGTSGPNNDESTARGTVVALAEGSGDLRWRTYTVPPGHDGGAVWTTPAIDRFGRLYVGTGNAYHSPAADTTDAMLVLSAAGGEILGHYQTVPGDVWEIQNPTAGPDWDFGASPNLITSADGRALVGEGNKSGTYWALDRQTMQPVWSAAPGPGSQADGGINSTAYDGRAIYGSDAIDSQIFALGRDGKTLWNSVDAGAPHFGPVAVANHVLYSTDPAGFLTARDTATGTILTKVPLGHPTFGGVSVSGHAVYVATGLGPPLSPDPSVDTSQMDGSGSIIAFGDTGSSTRLSHSGPFTFSGTCQLSGEVRFDPPVTNAPQDGDVAGTLSGTCSGTLSDAAGNSRSLDGRAVRSWVRSHGTESCDIGQGQGRGALIFGSRRVRFTYDEVRTGPNLVLHVAGAKSGDGLAQGNVSPSADPAPILQACGADGLKSAPVDARIATNGITG
jgi:polyvinyl alcohol dehydrogenase (cytochrome)